MRLLHHEHPLHHRHHHYHHHHHHQQEEEELLQQQQANQQELQRQRILSLFESSPPPEPSEDTLPDHQPALSFDLFPLPRPGKVPRAVEAASLDFAESGSGAEVGSQAILGAGAVVGADVQVRKRRGRPPRFNGGGCGPVASSLTGRREDEEEDVCFICFDGGTLVLCDRRGCPKAYHPACIKRDESFFRSKAKWNCGWHICSSCQKASYYMCYTCTYSLCKNCTRGADYVCVRGTKGLCGTCMKTIMLIESVEHRNKEMVQVDFDDKLSWEYLFKVYWICLKEKLSLTFEELTSAKNPWKDPEISFRESIGVLNTNGLESFKHLVENGLNGVKRKRKGLFRNEVDSGSQLPCGQSSDERDWASKELLEFVSHMKNGDTSVLSQFDLEALLLEYVNRNNLRDPQKKCQIICDSRLFSLFGKGVVGHSEMLKLLEYHILVKVDGRVHRGLQGAVTDTDAPLMDSTSCQNHQISGTNKRHRNRKRSVEKVHSINREDQAAIDVHNINLIYLRRDLLEKLVNAYDSFHEMAAGCFVRIKISSDDPRQEIYRLVQIVGTSELDEPNKTDGRIGKVILEILNTDKKESIPVDEISNQDFSEDECRRLRENINSGLTNRLTLGDIQKKATVLHALKVNDWLETEITRLNCLRDRASEKGHLKELRECVEKLELLNSPTERQRRLNDLPKVHKASNMDPDYKSEVIGKSSVGRKRKASVPQETSGILLRETRSRSQRRQASYVHQDTKILVPTDIHGGPLHSTFEMNGAARIQAQEVSAASSSMTEINGGTDQSVNDIEIYKIWHYRDPQRRVQGPFTLLQLRKWNLNGHFPIDLRIWRTDGSYEDSILLTEALSGWHGRGQAFPNKGSDNKQDSLTSGYVETNIVEQDCVRKDSRFGSPCKADNEIVLGNGLAEPSSCRASAVDDVKMASTEEQTKNILSIMLDFAISGDASIIQDKSGGPVQLPTEVPVSYVTSKILSAQEKSSDRDHQSEQVGDIDISDQQSGQNWVNQLSVGDAVIDKVSTSPNITQQELERTTQKKAVVSSPKPEVGKKELKGHISENMQSLANIPALETTNPSWTTGTSSLVACDPLPLPPDDSSLVTCVPQPLPPDEVNGEWVVYSAATSNGWESGLVSVSSFRSDEIAIDHTSATNAGISQLMHSSPRSIPDTTTTWQAHDFTALAEESVSDLLAEVEAMECMGGLPSPTSKLKSAPDLAIEDGNDNCFSPVEGFSPPPDPGKGEDFTSTNHVVAPPQPIITDTPHASADNGSLTDDQKKSITSATLPRPMSRGTNWDVSPITTNFATGPVQADPSWGADQQNRHMNYAGTSEGNAAPATDWGVRHGTAPGGRNACFGSLAGGPNPTVWSNQQRFGNNGHRYPGARDRGSYQGADLVGFNRNRSSAWIKQYTGGGNGGGGGFQHTPRGPRVCKFHEAGFCKKGASCGYLHR
ncbi:hypothetical protein MLD38_028660 [Melastoma candidum]|uniref:Uncharacterized protein n=1 Tax=Melastoma candidum TaxID=119954 RepID=A0ACB9N7I0_9MYRT|nr:hypothetical protein MLD38_028660 [Melastoma candidum]